MLMLFVDETNDSKFKDYFGLACAMVNSNFYSGIKREFNKIFSQAGWDRGTEFKGSCLFSATSGCLGVPVEKRIQIASKILSLNVSKKNARMRFGYFKKLQSRDFRKDYLNYLPRLLEKILPKAKKGAGGKDLISIHYDQRSDLKAEDVYKSVSDIITKKKYVLYENVVEAKSNFESVGILYADMVGYLSARIDTIKNDSELFENIPPEEFENNGKIKKLKSSISLIELIKRLDVYKAAEN